MNFFQALVGRIPADPRECEEWFHGGTKSAKGRAKAKPKFAKPRQRTERPKKPIENGPTQAKRKASRSKRSHSESEPPSQNVTVSDLDAQPACPKRLKKRASSSSSAITIADSESDHNQHEGAAEAAQPQQESPVKGDGPRPPSPPAADPEPEALEPVPIQPKVKGEGHAKIVELCLPRLKQVLRSEEYCREEPRLQVRRCLELTDRGGDRFWGQWLTYSRKRTVEDVILQFYFDEVKGL